MAADFVPRGDSFLGAASFYAQSPNTAYDIYLASSLNDHSTWLEMAAGTVAAAGYQTIPFATQPKAAAGLRFYMIVELTSPTTAWPIAVEDAQKGYSSKATAAAGESYISADGSPGSWIDSAVARGADRLPAGLRRRAHPRRHRPGHQGARRGQGGTRPLCEPALPSQRRDRQR